MPSQICIELGRVSAFYTPTLVTLAGGYLEREGLQPQLAVASGGSSIANLISGKIHVAQSAPSRSLGHLREAERAAFAHFALVNQRDGFFLVARPTGRRFDWEQLRGATVLADAAPQPLAMLRFAASRRGLDLTSFVISHAGPEGTERAFADGAGDYVHLQGPAAQRLEAQRAGRIVACIGDTVGPVAFTSLAASWGWLESDEARRFVHAYRNALDWIAKSEPSEIAQLEARFFPDVDVQVLTRAVSAYRTSGTWSTQVEITQSLFDRAMEVFVETGELAKRPRYEQLIAPVPG